MLSGASKVGRRDRGHAKNPVFSQFLLSDGTPLITSKSVYGMEARDMVQTISREELKAKIDRHDPFILAEVLAPGQYERAHLPGAVNLPPDRVIALAAMLLPDKEQEIVVYCGGPT